MANNRVKFRYGICQNSHMEDTGKPCPLCQSKEIQRVVATKELVCSECKARLKEIPRPATFWEKYGKMLIAGIAVLVIGGAGAWLFLSGDEKDTEPISVTLNHVQKTLKVGEQDTLVPAITPEDPNASIIWQTGDLNIVKVNNGIVEAIAEGSDSVVVQVLLNGGKTSVACNYTVTAENNTVTEENNNVTEENNAENDEQVTSESKVQTVSKKPWANYASFDGTTMTFKKRHVIPGTDQVANPGDKVTGKWVNGEVNLVRWYHDGTSETLTHK